MVHKISLIEEKLSLFRRNYLSKRANTLIHEVSLFFDDTKYRKQFDSIISVQIYQMHLNECFTCCAFCAHLQKAICHEYCFKCLKATYDDCSSLLPGTFSFIDSYFDSLGKSYTPWIFRTPCTSFERLDSKKYFKNFISSDRSVTVTNYEALEGIFLGLSRGKRPCHICASVNMDIYNKCSESERVAENSPCNRVITEISSKYEAILGMIKYV